MQQTPQIRPLPGADPNLTVLPALSAPIDQGILIPRPKRSLWDRLVLVAIGALIGGAGLVAAFLHATALR